MHNINPMECSIYFRFQRTNKIELWHSLKHLRDCGKFNYGCLDEEKKRNINNVVNSIEIQI